VTKEKQLRDVQTNALTNNYKNVLNLDKVPRRRTLTIISHGEIPRVSLVSLHIQSLGLK